MREEITKWLEKLPKHTLAIIVLVTCTLLARTWYKNWERTEKEKERMEQENYQKTLELLNNTKTEQGSNHKIVMKALDSINMNQKRDHEAIKKNSRVIEIMTEKYDKNSKRLFEEIDKNYKDNIDGIKGNSYIPSKTDIQITYIPENPKMELPEPVKKNE